MFCIIYKITNKINDKVYVGQTWQSLKRRWSAHSSKSRCFKLANAIRKYGKRNFSIELLLVASTQSIADYWENYFIEKYDSISNGYNIREGGANGKVMSSETIRRMSLSHIGHKQSDDTKKKKSESLKGNNNALGKKLSDSTKKKMSKTQAVRQCGEGNNAAKITWDVVDEIRSSNKSSIILAEKYRISRRTICDIRRFKTWKIITSSKKSQQSVLLALSDR